MLYTRLTDDPVRSVQVLLHLPPFKRRLPHLLLERAAHAALLHAQYVAVGVAYELAHHRRVTQRVDERSEAVLLVRRGSDLEVGRSQDAQHVGDPAQLLYLEGDVGFGVLHQRERDELVGHPRDDPGHRADDRRVVRLAQVDPLQDGGGGDSVRVIVQRHHDHLVHGQRGLLRGHIPHADADGVRDEGDAGSGEVEHLEQRLVVDVVEAARSPDVLLVRSEQRLLDRQPHRQREGHLFTAFYTKNSMNDK